MGILKYLFTIYTMKKTGLYIMPIMLASIFAMIGCSNQKDKTEKEKAHADSLTSQVALLRSVNQQLEENKQLVANLYKEVFGDKSVDAVDKYIADNYIQHNPGVADGKEALKVALKVWFKGAQKEKIDIQHLGADGNFVYIHTRSKQGNKTVSVMDIFRIDGSKIVEHWDVLQEVPAKSANDHPMF
jgi:predicted SnoaL-like aldol condensation-catalyzing enzyme